MPRASRKKQQVNMKPVPQKPAVPPRTSPSKTSPAQPLTVSHAYSAVCGSPDTCVQSFPKLSAVSSSESLAPSTSSPDVLASVKSSLKKRLETDTQERARKCSTSSSIAPRKLQKQQTARERKPSSVSGYSASILSNSEYTPRSIEESESDTAADVVSPVSPLTPSDSDIKPIVQVPEEIHPGMQDSTNVIDTVAVESKESDRLPTLSLPFFQISMSPPAIATSALDVYPCPGANISGGDEQGTAKPMMKEIVGHLARWPFHTALAVASQLPLVGPQLPNSLLAPKPGETGGIFTTAELAIRTGIGLVVAGGWSAAGSLLSYLHSHSDS